MIRRIVFIVAALLAILLLSSNPQARVFFTGSNPALTVFAFPQDILLMPGETVYWYGSYQHFPWWGDIDEPENRPNKQYILTGEKTTQWSHDQAINQFVNMVGFSKYLRDSSKVRFDLDYTSNRLKADAASSAVDTARYSYWERHAIRDIYLTSMLATHYKNVPIGIKIGLGVEMTSQPDLEYFRFSGNSAGRSNRLLWGWNGNNYSEQDEYNLGSLFRFDAQLAATLTRLKVGGRLRLYNGTLDHYQWDGALDNYVPYPNKIRNITGRIYGIYNWYEQEKFKFNTTVLTRYTYVDSAGLDKQNHDIETGNVQKAKTFVFQINPNVNIYPWRYPMTYIDAAILCNYSSTNYDHLQPFNVGNGEKPGFVTSHYGTFEDYSWERYSFAREHFFELALDVNAAIPVIGMKDQTVALGVTMFLWRRYKWLDKYFGSTNQLDNDISFTIKNIRENLERETWLNSVINIIYRRGKYNFRLDIGQPLIYSLTPRTRLTDGLGNHIIYEKTRENMWLSQSGLKIGLFVSTSLENFLSYRIFHRSAKPESTSGNP
jgi:hypothetical protein